MSNSTAVLPDGECTFHNQCVIFISTGVFLGLILCCSCLGIALRCLEASDKKTATVQPVITSTPLHFPEEEEDPCEP